LKRGGEQLPTIGAATTASWNRLKLPFVPVVTEYPKSCFGVFQEFSRPLKK